MTYKAIIQIINNHVDWYVKVVRFLLFQDKGEYVKPHVPTLDEIYGSLDEGHDVDFDDYAELKSLSEEFIQEGERLLSSVNQRPLDVEPYKHFENLLSEITFTLESIQNGGTGVVSSDSQSVSSAVKPLSLDGKDRLLVELDHEIEKVKRHAYLFCLILMQIKDYKGYSEEEYNHAHALVTEVVHETLRPYDDAYLMDDGAFVLNLKYSDGPGGLNSFERIKEVLADKQIGKDTDIKLVASLMAAEEYDTGQGLLDKLYEELNNIKDDQDVALKYEENSSVLNYLKGSDE